MHETVGVAASGNGDRPWTVGGYGVGGHLLLRMIEADGAGGQHRPFLYFPLRHHCEQNYHVAHRLERRSTVVLLSWHKRSRGRSREKPVR